MNTFFKVMTGIDAWFECHAVTACIVGGVAVALIAFVAIDYTIRFPIF